MKKAASLIIAISVLGACSGQMNAQTNAQPPLVEAIPNTNNKVVCSVEQMPEYPGGDAALMQYVSENLRYPEAAAKDSVQGRVVVQFVVTKTGKIGAVKVVRSVHPALDAEAVRIVKSIPKPFKPGRQNGQRVNVWYTLPINFRIY